jgi:hypothetical protein
MKKIQTITVVADSLASCDVINADGNLPVFE